MYHKKCLKPGCQKQVQGRNVSRETELQGIANPKLQAGWLLDESPLAQTTGLNVWAPECHPSFSMGVGRLLVCMDTDWC